MGHGSPLPCWGYGTHNGPERWGDLRPEFGRCATGREQSPVDLRDWRHGELTPVDYDYGQARISVETPDARSSSTRNRATASSWMVSATNSGNSISTTERTPC